MFLKMTVLVLDLSAQPWERKLHKQKMLLSMLMALTMLVLDLYRRGETEPWQLSGLGADLLI